MGSNGQVLTNEMQESLQEREVFYSSSKYVAISETTVPILIWS